MGVIFNQPETVDTSKLTDKLFLHNVSGSLPTLEQSKKAMLRRKTKFVNNIDKFSSRKNAYKQGWKDCYDWIISQGNDRIGKKKKN